MVAAEAQTMSDAGPFAGMSPAVVALLRDEANLSTARHVLEDARHDCLNRREALAAQRPAFGFLAGKKQRDDYTAAMSAVETQLQVIDTMVARVTNARERLHPGLRAAMIEHLNRVDPMYHQGLRASRFHEHWRRAHAVVADRVKGFIRDTREVQTAIGADVSAGRARFSGDTIWRLNNLRTAAAELDREIAGLNEVSAGHASFVASTPFAQIRLPVLENWGCIQKVDTLTLKTPVDGVTEVTRMMADLQEFRQPSLTTVLTIFEAMSGEHAQLAESRLRQCWSVLLAHAEAHLVSDADLEPTLADIERRQAEAERARVLGQVYRPFDSER